ncbi:MAG: CoA-binding protein, partial [Clostridia bacterium]|nr:CoA-binding protein [Clostridia bacterium]
MSILNKDFFEGNEVIFVGYSGKNQGFCGNVHKAFINNGIKVYAVNNKEGGTYDIKVYKHLEELPKIPKTAYVLQNKENSQKAVKELAEKGVRKILFQSSRNVDASTLEECKKMGIETIVACPMMKFGSGIHKLHGFFAGVR